MMYTLYEPRTREVDIKQCWPTRPTFERNGLNPTE